MRRILLLPVLVLLFLASGLTESNAAALRVTGGSLNAFSQSRCTNETVIVSSTNEEYPDTNHITVSGIPSNICSGKIIVVSVHDENTGIATTFTSDQIGVVGAATSLDFSGSMTNFRHNLVILVTIGGWAVSSNTWLAPSVPSSCTVVHGSGTCTATAEVSEVTRHYWRNNVRIEYSYIDLAYTVKTSSKNVDWQVALDLSNADLSTFGLPVQIRQAEQLSGECADLPILELTGHAGSSQKFNGSVRFVVKDYAGLWDSETYPICTN